MSSGIATRTTATGNWYSSDKEFHRLYPVSIQQLANRHWTPLQTAKQAAQFLVPEAGSKVLDIGSGVGKFCLSAAYYKPDALLYGVEQRKDLIDHAETAREILGLTNVNFIHGNFTQLNLRNYDHFYFYNSFYENLDDTDRIDNNIQCSETLYNKYNHSLYRQLAEMPPGTRVVTLCSWEEELPPSYHIVHTEFENMLKFHIKE